MAANVTFMKQCTEMIEESGKLDDDLEYGVGPDQDQSVHTTKRKPLKLVRIFFEENCNSSTLLIRNPPTNTTKVLLQINRKKLALGVSLPFDFFSRIKYHRIKCVLFSSVFCEK